MMSRENSPHIPSSIIELTSFLRILVLKMFKVIKSGGNFQKVMCQLESVKGPKGANRFIQWL